MSLTSTVIGGVARHWPFANGGGRLIDRLGSRLETGSGIQQCRTSDGFEMSVLGDDLIGRHILLSGQFDRSILGLLLDFAERGDQCIDVGANIGYVSCLLLHKVPGSKIISVEPQPGVVDLLRVNLGRFDPSRYEVVAAGLSDSDSEGFMHINPANRGGGTLVGEKADDSVTVPLISAAKVFGKLERLDLIKMDIEGHEENVFTAARAEIARLQPKAILFEDQKGKAAPDGSIGKLLGEIGYDVYAVHKTLLKTNLVPLRRGDQPSSNDYVALSRTRALPPAALRKHRISGSG